MAFTPVNELERLLVAAATDPAARAAFYRGITQHELLVITEGEMPEGKQRLVAGPGAKMQIRMIEAQGKPHAPIFTSAERISAVVPNEVGIAAMKGEAVLTMLRGKDLVLNPGSPYGKIFTAQEVEGILTGAIFRPQETPDVGGKEILLGQPKEYPRHITEALSRLFARLSEVKAAYLAQAFIPGTDQTPHTLIGIEMAGDCRKVIGDAGVVVREVAKAGEIVDFVQCVPNVREPIADYMRRKTTPFYVRKKWLGLF